MDEALHCDRVAVMRAGVALAVDSPSDLLARGRATVTIWRGDKPETTTVDHYPERLPDLLGLDTGISRIEVRQDTLEDIVLNLIEEKQADLQVVEG
jgi:ABC-type multidrug transport system ATPase subunit